MKSHVTSKMLALIVAAVLPLQIVLAKSNSTEAVEEKQQVRPHVLHAGLGYSYIPGVYVYKAAMSIGSVNSGIGLSAGYEYLFPASHWSVGVSYTYHHSGGMAKYTPITTSLPIDASLPVDFYVHNMTPTVGGHWEWGKHAFKIAAGVGYIYSETLAEVERLEMNGVEIEREEDEVNGLSLYLSLEYEYRFSPKAGLFVKLHDMEHYDKPDDDEEDWEGIVGYGVSIGLNYHF